MEQSNKYYFILTYRCNVLVFASGAITEPICSSSDKYFSLDLIEVSYLSKTDEKNDLQKLYVQSQQLIIFWIVFYWKFLNKSVLASIYANFYYNGKKLTDLDEEIYKYMNFTFLEANGDYVIKLDELYCSSDKDKMLRMSCIKANTKTKKIPTKNN
jgi:hypothetical protein